MSYTTHRDAVVAILEAVPGIGRVHNRLRWLADQRRMLDLCKDETTGKLHVWMVTRERSPETAYTCSETERAYGWCVHGYYPVDDDADSEGTFQALVEAVCDALRAHVNLDDLSSRDCDPPAARLVDHRMYAGVLCHHAEITTVSYELEEVGRG